MIITLPPVPLNGSPVFRFTGPYELHPQNPLLSSRENPRLVLQKAGHGDLFQTQTGEWYIAFLVGRPLSILGRCTLGRETAIQKLVWEEGQWPRLSTGGREPEMRVEAPALPAHPFKADPYRDNFNQAQLQLPWQSLRIPVSEDWLSLSERPGFLRLKGRESLTSFQRQSLLARRIQHFNISASTALHFNPGRLLQILSCDKYEQQEVLKDPLEVPEKGAVKLRVDFDGAKLKFYYALEEKAWIRIGHVLDGSILSDEYIREDVRYRPAFTGAFVGLCCQDHSGKAHPADFECFEYREI